VRIAAGVVQGIAYGLDLPVIPVSSLEVLAQGVLREKGERRVLAAFDARMGEVYWASCVAGDQGLMTIQGRELLCAPGAVPVPEEGDWCGAGSGWQTYDRELGEVLGNLVGRREPQAQCHAGDAAVLAAARFAAGHAVAADQALPVYLRDKVAWKKVSS